MDQVVAILENHSVFAVAFALWAIVVFHFGRQIMHELRIIHDYMRAMNYKLSNRITKVEAHLEHKEGFTPYSNGEG